MASAPDVVVVGGGVAGLAAATALVESGARVLVVEARGVLGGRTTSVRDRVTGTVIDNGQHIVLGCYRETFAYLDRIGARDGIALQPRLEMPVIDRANVASTLRCPSWPSPWNLLAGLIGWPALGWRDRLAAIRLGPELLRAGRLERDAAEMGRLAGETVGVWLRRHHQTARLCELLWEPLAVAALNQHIESAAAAPFVRVLGEAFGSGPGGSAIGLPVKPLASVFGEPAREYLARRGSRVDLHAPARLVVSGARACGVEVRGRPISAGTVVAAIPWHGWRTFWPAADGNAAAATVASEEFTARRSSPVVTVNVWLDRRVLDHPFVGLPGRVFQWVFERTVAEPCNGTRAAAHLSFVSSGADPIARTPDDRLIAQAWDELRAARPPARDASLVHASVIREHHATFSLAPGEPPRPGAKTAIEGLWLAGDWTDTGLPATIEGAIRSGHLVAHAIAARARG